MRINISIHGKNKITVKIKIENIESKNDRTSKSGSYISLSSFILTLCLWSNFKNPARAKISKFSLYFQNFQIQSERTKFVVFSKT
jgi:hypothetical protein